MQKKIRTKVTDYKVGEKIILKSDGRIYPIIEIDKTILNGIIVQGEGCGLCCVPEEVYLATNKNIIKVHLEEIKAKEKEIKELKNKIKKLDEKEDKTK